MKSFLKYILKSISYIIFGVLFFYFIIWISGTSKISPLKKDFYIEPIEILAKVFGVDHLLYSLDEGKKNINFIRSGTMSSCKNTTTGKMIDDFMRNPKWSSGITEDNIEYVNVEGNIMYREREITAGIQFILNKKSFSVHTIAFNEIVQNKLMINSLFEAMCDSSSIKRVQ